MKNILITATAAAMLLAGSITTTHAADNHLFYIHGCCVKGTTDPKVKPYEAIVQALRDDGFKVTYELRTSDVADSDAAAHAYAEKIAGQVRALLAKGTAPEDITVAGYSLGSMTTMVVAGLIGNPKVNYVLLAGCPINPAIKVSIDYAKIKGHVLSIPDSKDVKFGSCNGKFGSDVTYKEIMLESGRGHEVFRLTDAAHLKLWKDPLVAWTRGK